MQKQTRRYVWSAGIANGSEQDDKLSRIVAGGVPP
jgi:hypothetical protein